MRASVGFGPTSRKICAPQVARSGGDVVSEADGVPRLVAPVARIQGGAHGQELARQVGGERDAGAADALTEAARRLELIQDRIHQRRMERMRDGQRHGADALRPVSAATIGSIADAAPEIVMFSGPLMPAIVTSC